MTAKSKQDTTLDRVRFRILPKRLDASVYCQEYQDWLGAVEDLNKTFHLPVDQKVKEDEEDPDDCDTLTLRRKLDLGLIDEDDYYDAIAGDPVQLPDKPEADWYFTPSIVDLDYVGTASQYPKPGPDGDLDQTIVWFVGGGWNVYKVDFYQFYEMILSYREQKHGKRDLIEILSKNKASESGTEGEEIRP